MNSIIPWVLGGFLTVVTPLVGMVGTTVSYNQADLEAARQENVIVSEYEIKPGDTFPSIVGSFKIPYEQALAIIESSKDIFDFTKIQAGRVLKLVFVNEAFASVEYPLSSDTLVVVEKEAGGFKVKKEPIQYQVTQVVAKGTINGSLFVSAQESGIGDKTIMDFADIFSSDVDFAADIKNGDSFSIIYEKRSLDGKEVGAGKILAAKFTNDENPYEAFLYNDKYYNAEGESLAGQFLKSPLNYARISSGYSYSRTNPVTKQVTAHRAIDYAAAQGTPIIATAAGKVITAGSKGGLGITVELRHGSYMTQYAHMSGIAKGIKNGAEVQQGDIIGYVGSTGISTGPHLQYAMFNNDNPINPLTSDFSRGEPLEDSQMKAFAESKNKIKKLLE